MWKWVFPAAVNIKVVLLYSNRTRNKGIVTSINSLVRLVQPQRWIWPENELGMPAEKVQPRLYNEE
jgi:hypothetical protein